jgi:hypothetical protein
MTSKSSNPNKTTALALDQKAIQGVQKYLTTVKSITVAGTTYTPATITSTLQAEIDADKAVDTDLAQYKQQVVAARLARSKGSAMRKVLKTYVLGAYGADAVQVLQDFGIPVPKTLGQRTAAVKAKAAASAKATRQAHEEAIASVDARASAPPAPAAAATPAAPTK